MDIVDYHDLDSSGQARMRDAIARAEWRAAAFLASLLEQGTLRQICGPHTRLLLGLEEGALAAFCTLSNRDEVDAPDMAPWIGFVYTFPEFRGCRRSEEMIRHACAIARETGYRKVFISTDHTGLYEKYGFRYMRNMRTVWGGDARAYEREV